MIGLTGKSVKAAFAKYAANSWNVAASVTKGAYFNSDGGLKPAPQMVQDDAFGQSFRGSPEVGDYEAQDLSLPTQTRYDDHMYIFDALAMGSPAAVTLSNSATGQVPSFKHLIDLADVIDGLGITMAFDKSYYVDELTSAKVYGWDESDGENGRITTTYKVLGTKPTVLSSVNINSTVGGANFPAQTNRVFRKQASFRLNAQSAASLGASDVVKYETARFSWARVLDRPIPSGQNTIDEPADNGYPDFTLEVTFPRANTVTINSLRVGMEANVTYKGDLTFTGANINSTDAYKRMYEFPELRIMSHEGLINGAAQVKPRVVFGAFKPASAPTNMPLTTPFRLTRIMTNSAAAF